MGKDDAVYYSRDQWLIGQEAGMTEIESLYKKENGKVLIEIKLSSIIQLFNSFDPAPFYEKQLDSDADKYIVDTIRDFPKNTQFKIVVHLPRELALSDQAATIKPAIHNHYQYMCLVTGRKFRQMVKYGRDSLIIGLSLLIFALIARQLILHPDASFFAQVFADAFLILGWVAMWEPATVLLYQLWPILKEQNIYKQISEMDIDIIPSS